MCRVINQLELMKSAIPMGISNLGRIRENTGTHMGYL